MILTYKYRIKDKRAKKALTAHAFAVNQVWNWCVAQQRDVEARYHAGAPKRKWASHFDLAMACNGIGAEIGIHQQTVQKICRKFAQSRHQHGCPHFRASFGTKRARGWVPFSSQGRQINGNTITYLGKRYRFWEGRRSLPETVQDGAFVEDARGHWHVIFHVEIAKQSQAPSGAIGIDLGLKSLASISTGEIVENPRHLNQWAERLAIAPRAGNKRRATAIYARIANTRADFHHKLSTRLAREYAFIAVGNVNAKNLAKTRMAKSVLDAGWSSFRNMLRYKAATFVEVDEKFTTVTCSACGARSGPQGQKGLRIREWSCAECDVVHDRDHNSAKNILALSAQRRGDESRRAT